MDLPEPTAPVVLVPDVGGQSSSPSISSPSQAQPVQAAAGRPFFNYASERYEWLMQHRAEWDSEDALWVASYVEGDDYAGLVEYFAGRGLEWKDGEVGFKSAR